MDSHSKTAMKRAMRAQEVIFEALAKKLTSSECITNAGRFCRADGRHEGHGGLGSVERFFSATP
jgi:hypothetical protein